MKSIIYRFILQFVLIICSLCSASFLNAQEYAIKHIHEGLHTHDNEINLPSDPASDFCNYGNSSCGVRIDENMGRALLFTGNTLTYATDICNSSLHHHSGMSEYISCNYYDDGSCNFCGLGGEFGGVTCENEFPSFNAFRTAMGCIGNAYAMRPQFIYMQVNQAGNIVFDFAYSGGDGSVSHSLNADFAIWGPFDSKYEAFTTTMTNPSWLAPFECSDNLPVGNTESLSVNFAPAHVNKYFVMMVVPMYCANKSFNVSITRNISSTGSLKPDVCNISNVSVNPQSCVLSKHAVTGVVTYTNPPAGGRLCITSSNAEDTVFITSYGATSASYTLNNVECTGETGDIIAWFEYPIGTNTGCLFTVCYQAPIGICPIMEVKGHNSGNISACESTGDIIKFTFKNANDNSLLDISTYPVTFSYTVNGILNTITDYSGVNPYEITAYLPARYTGISVQTASCIGTVSSTLFSDTTVTLVSSPVITGPVYVASCPVLGNLSNTPKYLISFGIAGTFNIFYKKPDGTTGNLPNIYANTTTATSIFSSATDWEQNGIYKFVATSTLLQCQSDTLSVRRVTNSLKPGIYASDTALCAGNVTLSLQAPFRLQSFILELYKVGLATPIVSFNQSNISAPYSTTSPNPFTYTVNSQGQYYVKLHSIFGANVEDCGNEPYYSDTIEITSCQLSLLTVSPSDTTICYGNSVTLRANGNQGAIFKWYDSPTGGTLLYTGNPYTVSPASTTNYYVSQTVASTESGRVQATVTVNALPEINISGNLFVCETQTTQLTASTPSGTWQSLNPAIATVNSSGLVTGISAGNATIRYIAGSGSCIDSADVTITVNALPVVNINGNLFVCENNTTQLTASPPSGTWQSLNPAIATVNSSGLVTGVSAGNATIRYIAGSGSCIDSADVTITVGSLPNVSINGNLFVCENHTTQLTASTPSGTWQSLNPAIATVNSSGLVTGVSAGNATIRYIAGSGSCIDSADVT
ncbi:MAG: Ig-like domain-containing protein, partial [Prevotellaceae bacterium]|nr:Ig-like domain-containing protein [Prevotellaceae bacterium]